MNDLPSPEEFRAAGFDETAAERPRSPFAFRLLCAFNGVEPDKAPRAWRYYPNQWTADAWERVADEAVRHLVAKAVISAPM